MKKHIRLLIYIPLFITIIGMAYSCQPKTHDGKIETATQKFKITTKIPDGIAIPDRPESRIGILNLFDGFTDGASSEKEFRKVVRQI